jgi:hypothetical protein
VNSGTVAATGTSGQLQVTFTPLTAAQRNGSQEGEIEYSWRTAYGSGAIPAGGGTIGGQPNGTDVVVNIVARSIKANISGDAKAIGSGNPYGPPDAPNVNGGKSATGDGEVHWTWNNPNMNGRPLDHFEVSYDNGGWINVGKANRYDRGGGGWDQQHNLRVRAVTVVNGAIGSANATTGNDPTPPPPPNRVAVNSADINSCTEVTGGSGYDGGTPKRCYGVASPGGAGAPSPWLSVSDGGTPIDRCGSPWGTSGWYHISGASASGKNLDGRWVRADTVHFVSGSRPC